MNQVILIGGENRPVSFGRNFWSEVELISGKSISQLLDIQELKSVRNQLAIAYSALKWGEYEPKTGREPNPKYTLYQVGDWIDANPDVMKDFYKYLTESLPKKKEDEASDQK